MLIHDELRRMSHEEAVPYFKVTFEIFLEKTTNKRHCHVYFNWLIGN
jgi:hypothetical protein